MFGHTIADVVAYPKKAAGELSSIEILDDTKKKLAQELQNVYNKLQLLAGELSERRKAAAKDIESTVEAELAYLNLDKTVFEISIVPMQPGVFDENGSDEVEFLISTNPGEQPRPLSKIVSGGELSRIMLALKAILGTKDGIVSAEYSREAAQAWRRARTENAPPVFLEEIEGACHVFFGRHDRIAREAMRRFLERGSG